MITIIPLEFIDLQGDGYHLSISLKANNKTVRMILDTGASRTVFDMNRINQFMDDISSEPNEQLSTGLGTNSMESNIIKLNSFQLGDLLLRDYSTVAIDMVHINSTYEMLELPLIDGVLGGDILQRFNAIIDYRNGLLKLKFPKRKYYYLFTEKNK